MNIRKETSLMLLLHPPFLKKGEGRKKRKGHQEKTNLLCLVDLESAVTLLEESDDLVDASAAAVGVGLLGLGTRLDLAEGAALAKLGGEVGRGLGRDIGGVEEGGALLHLGH